MSVAKRRKRRQKEQCMEANRTTGPQDDGSEGQRDDGTTGEPDNGTTGRRDDETTGVGDEFWETPTDSYKLLLAPTGSYGTGGI